MIVKRVSLKDRLVVSTLDKALDANSYNLYIAPTDNKVETAMIARNNRDNPEKTFPGKRGTKRMKALLGKVSKKLVRGNCKRRRKSLDFIQANRFAHI